MLMLSVNFGILLGFILSTHLDYHLVPFISICLPIIYLIGSCFFPETPQHLLKKNQYQAAEKSFEFYKNCSVKQKQQCSDSFDNLKLNIENVNRRSNISYRDFGKYMHSRVGLKCFGEFFLLNFD